jgi:lipid-A-disaccharide synthase
MTGRPLRLLIVAGEVSGDLQAARLIRALKQHHPDVECFGIGGDALRAEGMEILTDARHMAVMGLTEVLKRLFFFRRVFFNLLAEARKRRPDAVLLVDYPGFNLRFAERAHRLGLKVIYYICPQVWAWNRRRIPHMAQIVDRLISIFPFEPDVFKDTNLKVNYVGHPFYDEARAGLAQPPPELPWAGSPHLALLPGSRRHEIQRLLPPLLETARRLLPIQPQLGVLIAAPSREIGDWVQTIANRHGGLPPRTEIVCNRTRDILRTATAALVASGTATLESGLMGCPTVILYKMSWPTYWLGRRLVHIRHIGMLNIIADRRICPEFLQAETHPDNLLTAIRPLLEDSPARREMIAGLTAVREMLGPSGASERAAEVLLEELTPQD